MHLDAGLHSFSQNGPSAQPSQILVMQGDHDTARLPRCLPQMRVESQRLEPLT